jgi:AcrR family transcriptional regulator
MNGQGVWVRLAKRPSRRVGIYQKGIDARRAVVAAAYRLFAQRGIHAVAIEDIVARSKVAKVTLYRHFRSKEDLVLAVLEMHERAWCTDWLQAEVLRRSDSPRDRLLAIFTLFHEWFLSREFAGCPFTRVVLETEPGSALHRRAQHGLDRLHEFLVDLAAAANVERPRELAAVWHILMKGCIVSAHGGNTNAALEAHEGAKQLLANWPRLNT